MAVLAPAEGVPGGEAGLGLPGVLGLDELEELQNENKTVNKYAQCGNAVHLNTRANRVSPKIQWYLIMNLV